MASGDPNLFPQPNIPRSTVRTWLKQGSRNVVKLDDDDLELYLHHLDSIATVRRLVAYYIREHNEVMHNEVMPHWAFNGVTPDEVYFGKTDGVVETLEVGRVVARAERLKANQALSCPSCPRAPPQAEREESTA